MAVGRPDVSVIIPAYNEEKRLAPTVREAVEYFRGRSRSAEIIVVDDGSKDRTSDLTRCGSSGWRRMRGRGTRCGPAWSTRAAGW
jgi:GT2 family glycosyltransferase